MAGSGGGYLSNEVMYRTLRLRSELGAEIPVGHLHVPLLKEPTGLSDSAFVAQRDAIVSRVRYLLRAALATLT